MALNLALQNEATNLYAYIQSYKASFAYDGHGWFNGMGTAGDQWVAGNSTPSGQPTNVQYSAIMLMNDYSYEPGDFEGTVTELSLGRNLVHNFTSDIYTQTNDLIITPGTGFLPATAAFQQGIYALSHGGELDGGSFEVAPGRPPITMLGLTDWFAEQGTNQTGSTGDDVLLSFAGDDVLTGNGSVDWDSFLWNADYYETVGVVSDANGVVKGWGDDVITDFVDGVDEIQIEGFGWADEVAFQAAGGSLSGNVISYVDAALGVTSTITVNFNGAGSLGWDDIVFTA